MNRTLLSVLLLILCFASLALTASNGKVHAQALPTPLRGYSIVIPYPGSHDAAMAASMAASREGRTIPLDSITFTASKDGRFYTDVIVGESPFEKGDRNHPTHVKILLVPMEVHIGSNVFDSTAKNFCGGSLGHSDLDNFLDSPILTPVDFDGGSGVGHAARINSVDMGEGTYNNTHRRAEFLKAIGGPKSDYGVLYDVKVTPKQVITAATSARP
jgi:hypothetical protein